MATVSKFGLLSLATLALACGGDSGAENPPVDNPPQVDPPRIVSQPATQIVTAGDAATFTMVAEGSTLAFQWFKDDVALPGRTSSGLTISAATGADEGSYHAVASNSAGSVASDSATLTVNDPTGNHGVTIR